MAERTGRERQSNETKFIKSLEHRGKKMAERTGRERQSNETKFIKSLEHRGKKMAERTGRERQSNETVHTTNSTQDSSATPVLTCVCTSLEVS